jgi:hypothetical protein
VHTSQVLSEKILTIEIVPAALKSIGLRRGILRWAGLGLSASSNIAFPVLQIEVLAVYVSLPFILVAKG